ncbi:MAG TPA: hypothetical protein VMU84_14580, partial [Thermoanaerobaculia bacterium]|nr:hypothetical protein [Thermoanaerobaculia bacterium]
MKSSLKKIAKPSSANMFAKLFVGSSILLTTLLHTTTAVAVNARITSIHHFAELLLRRPPATGAISSSDAPIAITISGKMKMVSFQVI